MHQEREKGTHIAWLWPELCFCICIKLKEGKVYGSIQINEPTRCNSFTSLLLDVYVWVNMFRVLPCPSSGAYNCLSSLWFYHWSVVVAVLLVVVWPASHSVARKLKSMKNCNDPIGTRTHDLPACSIAAPQLTAPPHTPH
jgi:hypothetical protein